MIRPALASRSQALVLGLAAVALALRLPGLGWALPDVFEEATPLRQAWEIWGFGPMARFDLNPHFFRYPSLVIYLHFVAQALLYVGLLLGRTIKSSLDFQTLYQADPSAFFLMGRFINTLFGIGTVVLLLRLGRRAAGGGAAAAAAVLLAVNTAHIAQCQLVDVDVPLTFLVVWALDRAWCCLQRPTLRNALLAGAVAGLATSAKYTGAAAILPVVVSLVPWRRRRRSPGARESSAPASSRRRPATGASWALVGLALLAMVAAFCLTSPFVLLDPRAFWTDLSAERQHMELGHFGLTATPTIPFYLRALGQRMLGLPLALVGLAGLIRAVVVKRSAWAILVAAFVVPYAANVFSWNMKADRYLLPLMPLAMLLAAALVADAVRAADLRWGHRWSGAALWAVAVAALALPTAASYPDHVAAQRHHTRSQARAWIEQHVPAGAYVVTEWQGPELLSPLLLFGLEASVSDQVVQRSHRPVYAVQKLPVFQVHPERSAPFYDLALYPMADLIVTSDAIRSRYDNEPGRFAVQRAFYDTLEARYRMVAEFAGGRKASGPRIAIYRPAGARTAFGSRKSVPMPRPLKEPAETFAAGEGAHFFYEMGLNYEHYQFGNGALRAYELAETLPMQTRRGLLPAIGGAHARCLMSMGKPDEALGVLQQAQQRAHDPADLAQIRRLQTMFAAVAGRLRGG